MKINFTLVIAILLAIGLVAFSFTYYQTTQERDKLHHEIESRMDMFSVVIETVLANADSAVLNLKLDSLTEKFELNGLYIQNNKHNSSISKNITLQDVPEDVLNWSMAADTVITFISESDTEEFLYLKSFKQADLTSNMLVIKADYEYVNNIIRSIWYRNFWRWFFQALFVSGITLGIVHWRVNIPARKIINWVKSAKSGDIEQLKQHKPAPFLEPLYNEIINITKAMHDAHLRAEEEARLREKGESIWTSERLKIETRNLLDGQMLVLVSNREPYMHIHEGRQIKCLVPASGMISAMEPILKSCGGLWIASGTGDADKETVDKNDKVRVPPDDPKYTLKRLWLSKEEEDHFYYGFSNEGLWPLCHIAHTRPVFRQQDWLYYRQVNEKFAESVLEEIKDETQPVVLIQDYHFALLPLLIKQKRPDARVAIFWHIPWPNAESFGICPWQNDILYGMLGADLIGFHTQFHCNNFMETVNRNIQSVVNWDNFSIKINKQSTYVKPFPISIDANNNTSNDHENLRPDALLKEFGIHAETIGIGVDRIDYTKGLVEKFLAIERFFEKNPEYIGKFTFVQIGAPSRTLIKTYADIVSEVEKEAERINWKFKRQNWKAILLLKKHHSHEEIQPFYKTAQVCMVTSLHDGMNLVAKEYVASKADNTGVLILSRFAGASLDMKGAIIVNPYDIESMADSLKKAIEMPIDEQVERMEIMSQQIHRYNIYQWAASLLRSLVQIRPF